MCAIGKYKEDEGQGDCLSCLPGRFQLLEGAAACERCPVGMHKGAPGPGTCQPCPEGKFQPSTGSEQCEECKVNSHSGPGSIACMDCEERTFKLLVSEYSRDGKREGRYAMDDVYEQGGFQCPECRDGMRCPANRHLKPLELRSAGGGCRTRLPRYIAVKATKSKASDTTSRRRVRT